MDRPIWSPDCYTRALTFAAYAHQGQTITGTTLPYVLHVTTVSMEVLAALTVELGRDADLAVQAALLHDVIEDTAVGYDQVREEFGAAVADAVLALSKDPALARPLQMPDSLRRIRQQPPEVWMVKLADRITNLQPPPDHWTGDKIAQYRDEAIDIYHTLGSASETLATRLWERIEAYQAYIRT